MPTHSDRKIVQYQPVQMFDLVADVAAYPQFLPWCVGARIRSRVDDELVADLTIGFGPFRETFTSRVSLDPPEKTGNGTYRIRARYENGPFRYLNNQWIFTPHAQGSQVDFWVDFEFRTRILQAAIGVVFSEAVKRMVSAFLKRAQDVYGTATNSRAAAAGLPSAATRST